MPPPLGGKAGVAACQAEGGRRWHVSFTRVGLEAAGPGSRCAFTLHNRPLCLHGKEEPARYHCIGFGPRASLSSFSVLAERRRARWPAIINGDKHTHVHVLAFAFSTALRRARVSGIACNLFPVASTFVPFLWWLCTCVILRHTGKGRMVAQQVVWNHYGHMCNRYRVQC